MKPEKHFLINRFLLAFLIVNTLMSASLVFAQDNPVQRHKEVIRSIVDEVYNHGNVAAMTPIFTADYVRHPGESSLRDVKASILALRAAMPDMKATITLMIGETNWVALRMRIEGLLKYPLVFPNSPPVNPNNQPIRLEVNAAFRFNDSGQVFEEWNGFDNLIFLAQVGVIPPPQIVPDSLPDKLEVGTSGSESRNKETVRAYLDGIAQGNFSIVDQRFKPDLNAHNAFGRMTRQGLVADLTSLRQALPNLTVTINDLVAEGAWVAALYRIDGTFTNAYIGPEGSRLSPTNKPVALPIMTLFQFDDQGQVAESWELYDSWNFLSQLGLTLGPAPTQK